MAHMVLLQEAFQWRLSLAALTGLTVTEREADACGVWGVRFGEAWGLGSIEFRV